MRIGVLTGGGDCPGLNAVLRAVVRKGERHHGDEIVGFCDAWDGVMERRTLPLTVETMRGINGSSKKIAGSSGSRSAISSNGSPSFKLANNVKSAADSRNTRSRLSAIPTPAKAP